MTTSEDIVSEYAHILKDYLQGRNEATLNRLSQFGRKLADEGVVPQRILAMHLEVVRGVMKELPAVERPPLIALSFERLSEVLTGYGFAYRECMESVKELERSRKELEDAYKGIAETLVAVIEACHSYIRHHSERVTQYALDIAVEMGCSGEDREVLEIAAVLHDIGKIGIENGILHKAEPLTHSEWTRLKLHSIKSVQILRPLKFLEKALPIIGQLHERYDGKGYPHHYQGEQIPLSARILSIADAYDAMSSDRPYRPAMSNGEAIEELKQNAGTQFDPVVVKAFLGVLEGYGKRYNKSA